MKVVLNSIFVIAVALALSITGSLPGDEKKASEKNKEEPAKDLLIEAELANADLKDRVLTESFCKSYTFKMIEGRSYQIDMKSKAFDAFLRLENPQGTQVAADDDSGGMLNARIIYRAPKSGDYTICAMSLGAGSKGKFTLHIKDLQLEFKPIELKLVKEQASHKSNLAATDQRYNNKLHKVFHVEFEEGKTYQIDHVSGAFDAYLYLLSPDGIVLAEDDDSGGALNSRIIHKAEKTGRFQIIATSLNGSGTGNFAISVRENK
jgi:hypothetical protein